MRFSRLYLIGIKWLEKCDNLLQRRDDVSKRREMLELMIAMMILTMRMRLIFLYVISYF